MRRIEATAVLQSVTKVDVLVERRGRLEALLERHRQEEREQHLHAGQRDTKLAEQLGEVAVDALVVGLLATGCAGGDLLELRHGDEHHPHRGAQAHPGPLECEVSVSASAEGVEARRPSCR